MLSDARFNVPQSKQTIVLFGKGLYFGPGMAMDTMDGGALLAGMFQVLYRVHPSRIKRRMQARLPGADTKANTADDERTSPMLEKPEIAKTQPQPAAVIHITIPREEIRQVMGPGYHELMETIKAQGVKPAGPWFSHHLKMDPKVFDFEIGVPVEKPIEARGRVQPGELPAATVARTVYRGGYEGLPTAWGEFEEWIRKEGLQTAPNMWEVYAKGPESGSDPATWETELNRPITKS